MNSSYRLKHIIYLHREACGLHCVGPIMGAGDTPQSGM